MTKQKPDEQATILGAEPISMKEHAQRLADRKLTPKAIQKSPTGLFSDSATQIDLIDLSRRITQ